VAAVSLERAVRADLKRWPAELADTALAALALDIAGRLDGGMADTPAAQNYAQLRETLLRLAELAADVEVPEADEIDSIVGEREERRGLRSV
jgi:hypothetical protein